MKVLIVSLYKNSHSTGGIQAFLERLTTWLLKNSEIKFEHIAISDNNTFGKGNFTISKSIMCSMIGYDFVFVAGHNVPATDLIFLRAKMLGLPVVHMPFFHGVENNKRFGLSKIYFKIVRRFLYAKATMFFFVSSREAELFCEAVVDRSKCELTDHALAKHFSSYLPTQDRNAVPINVGYVGRPVVSKGFDLFLQISAQAIHNVKFKAIGPGLEDGLSSFQSKNKKRVKEHFSNQDIMDFYETCHVIIVPSKEESFGLAVIEALSMGCIVIASKNVPAAIKCRSVNSLKIIEEDFVVNAIAQLSEMIDEQNLGHGFAERLDAAKQIRAIFDEDTVYRNYERLLIQAIKKGIM